MYKNGRKSAYSTSWSLAPLQSIQRVICGGTVGRPAIKSVDKERRTGSFLMKKDCTLNQCKIFFFPKKRRDIFFFSMTSDHNVVFLKVYDKKPRITPEGPPQYSFIDVFGANLAETDIWFTTKFTEKNSEK